MKNKAPRNQYSTWVHAHQYTVYFVYLVPYDYGVNE